MLRADSKQPIKTLVDVRQGDQVYRIDDRSPLIKWSANYTVTSIGTGDGFDIIVVTTGGVTQYALVRTADIRNRRLPINTQARFTTTPTHVPTITATPTPNDWFAGWTIDQSEWVATGSKGFPKCLLVHGGPGPADSLAGMDVLAGSIAQRGGVGIAVKYPTMNMSFEDMLKPLYTAIAEHKPNMIIGHSLGGYFGGILAYRTGLPFVLLAGVHVIGDSYRLGMNGPLAYDEMAKSSNPVTIITASTDIVARIEYHQLIAEQLADTGHPGKWWIIDGATHDSVLNEPAAMNIIMASAV